MLSRRQVMAGLMGLSAVPLAGCASGVSPASAPPRPPATLGPVMNPGDFGLDAVIDLNHKAPVSDFASARLYSNILGVMHKASEGNDWFDPLYAQRRQQAEAAGLLWGAYHFGTHQHSGGEQAAAFLAAAQPGPDTLLALDLELNERVPSNSMDIRQAEDFVTAILVATGRLPLLYVQPAWADGEIHGRTGRGLGAAIAPDSLLVACDLWLADYRMQPELPRGWAGRGWRLWQYAGDGGPNGAGPFGPLSHSVAGVAHCDRNLFNGDGPTLARYWTTEAGRQPVG